MLWFSHCSVNKCLIQTMTQDSFQIILRIIVGLLFTLSISLGMIIDGRGEKGLPPPPSPGSPDSPIPPDDYFEVYSAAHNNHIPTYAYDTYPMVKGGNPIARDGQMMPYDNSFKGYPMPMLPIPPDGYPMPRPPTWNMTKGSRTLPTGQLDLSYCDMLFEAPVPPPVDEIPWFCICYQCKGGTIGPKGAKGDRGLPGPPGSLGKRGMTGFQGPPGFTGHQGPKGQKGDVGEKGDRGSLGFTGSKGERGFKGDKGELGIDGSPGPQGPPGVPGECPTICFTTRGSPGEPGPPGIAGARGLPGVGGSSGQRGQKGDLGESGPPGAPGSNGLKGNQGEKGECYCTDRRDGANGTIGLPGPKGSKGDMGHQGVAGVNGEKGQKGNMGEMGPIGPCSPAIQSAFSAALSSLYPQPGLPVLFTNVIYNRGFNFDPFSGIYKAPVNGTYVISYHVIVFSKLLKVGLYHNFKPIVKSTVSTNLATASQQVVMHLSMGDEVWLQVKDTDSNGMYASSESSSTFSGFLLYPDSCDAPMLRDLPEPIIGTYSWGEIEEPTTSAPDVQP